MPCFYFTSGASITPEDVAREAGHLLEATGLPYLVVCRGAALKVLIGPGKEAALQLIADLQAGVLAAAAEELVQGGESWQAAGATPRS